MALMVYVSVNSEYDFGVRFATNLQMPMTSEQIAKPEMVFFTRYGARARSNAGAARMRES